LLRTAWKTVLLVLRIVAGVALILAGIAGIFLPILPGWVLIALGIVLVAPNARIARWIKSLPRRLVRRFRRRWPRKSSK